MTNRKNYGLLALVILFGLKSAPEALGQEPPAAVHSTTAVSSDSRFELVQSPLVARLMLRVDRFSGVVSQLVVDTKSKEYWWSKIRMSQRSATEFTVYSDQRVHFQLFTSGIVVRNTFLMDVETGKTWSLTVDEKNLPWWEPIVDN